MFYSAKIIKVDGGEVFEGTLEQFEDCFFVFQPGDSTEELKLSAIEEWAQNHGWSFEVVE